MAVKVEVTWNGDRIDVTRGARRGLRKGGQALRRAAIPRTPVDTSNMRGSYHVNEKQGGEEVVVSNDAPYSVTQHERMDYHHDEGEAKFLENALAAERDNILAIIATEIRAEMS